MLLFGELNITSPSLHEECTGISANLMSTSANVSVTLGNIPHCTFGDTVYGEG